LPRHRTRRRSSRSAALPALAVAKLFDSEVPHVPRVRAVALPIKTACSPVGYSLYRFATWTT
jgi:hypothetical protein